MKIVILAVTLLAPNLGNETTKEYGALIYKEATRYKVDPLLLTAIIHVETGGKWDAYAVSKTNDYGLCQIHVSKSNIPRIYHKADILFKPSVNIHYGAKILKMWKNYHNRSCANINNHRFWAHYKFGRKVRAKRWSGKVNKIYTRLKVKYGEMSMKILKVGE